MKVLALIIAVFFVGCSTVKTYKDDQLGTAEVRNAGAAFLVEIVSEHGSVPYDGCILSLRKDNGYSSLDIELAKGREISLAELEPGQYRFHHVDCGARRTWNMNDTPEANFQVVENKISATRPIKVIVTDDLRMTILYLDHHEQREFASQLFKKLKPDLRAKLISGYSLERLTPASAIEPAHPNRLTGD